MCLYTKYITNKKYQPNRKNNFNAPICEDRRLLLVPAKCGKCIECRKARKREWIIRLNEEIRNNPKKATFWTLTISNEDYEKLKNDSKKKDRDSICKLAVKRMLERIRKKTKKSIRYWFITELGENTGRIHLPRYIVTGKREKSSRSRRKGASKTVGIHGATSPV